MEYSESLAVYNKAKAAKIRAIMAEGVALTPLQFGRARKKVSGWMYNGKMVIKYREMILFFKLWDHFESEKDMTVDEAIDRLELEGIQVNNKYYDLYWHARRVAGKFYLHNGGWFGTSEKDREIQEHRFVAARSEYLMGATDDDAKELIELGFERVPDLDY